MPRVMRKVTLHLYDLSNGIARSMSQAIIGKQLDGIWHSGIVVFGVEYFYGGGICAAPAGHAIPHLPYQEIHLGETSKTQVELEFYLQSINHRFTQATYSLLRHNCNNFANEVAQFLLNGQGIPEHIIRLPQEFLSSPLGATLAPMIEQMENQMRQQLVGGGAGLNPFGHIQSSRAVPAQETSKTLKLDGERSLLETAVNGIPITIMNDTMKKLVLSDKTLDKDTMTSLVDTIKTNFNPSKNPILMSFGTISRFMVGDANFRKPLLKVIGDMLVASIKSDNQHVVNTGLFLGVNLTASMDTEDVRSLKDVCFGSLLGAISKFNLETSNESQRKISLFTTNNLLVHFGNIVDTESITFFPILIRKALDVLSCNAASKFGDIKSLATSLETASSCILLREGRSGFKAHGIDTEKLVHVAEQLEANHGVSLQKTLELVLE
jgi:hypothetical protein